VLNAKALLAFVIWGIAMQVLPYFLSFEIPVHEMPNWLGVFSFGVS
jgi:hypothetical protein